MGSINSQFSLVIWPFKHRLKYAYRLLSRFWNRQAKAIHGEKFNNIRILVGLKRRPPLRRTHEKCKFQIYTRYIFWRACIPWRWLNYSNYTKSSILLIFIGQSKSNGANNARRDNLPIRLHSNYLLNSIKKKSPCFLWRAKKWDAFSHLENRNTSPWIFWIWNRHQDSYNRTSNGIELVQ